MPRALPTAEPMSIQNGHPTRVATRSSARPQFRVHQFAAGLGSFHLAVPPEDCGMMRGHLNRHDQAAESALGQGIKPSNEEPAKGATGVGGSTSNAGHRSSLVSCTRSSICFTAAWDDSSHPAIFRGVERVARCRARVAAPPGQEQRCDSGGRRHILDRR